MTPIDHYRQLKDRINRDEAIVGVVGLGYVGLPLVDAFVRAGIRAIGYDVDQQKIDKLNQAESYIGHISSKTLQKWFDANAFEATADIRRLADADAILVCVPTPLTESRDPDLSYVVSTFRELTKILHPGQLLILESTTYPGTSREVVLKEVSASGLTVGEEFFLAYSPEREDPGNAYYSAAKIPKVVGGIDDRSRELAAALYGKAVAEVVPVSSCEVAEACKILENTYRAVNIALVNELKLLCTRMDIDVWEVIEAAKTKPFGFSAFYPGPGLGGHCIPIDPFYMSWVARKHGMSARFIELAGEINSSMPEFVLRRLTEALNQRGKPVKGSKIALLGIAYKSDVDDPRESPSFVLLEGLVNQGAVVTYNDPHVPRLPRMRSHDVPAIESCELTPTYLNSQDCVLIATAHSAYDYDFIVEHSDLVIDTRNATKNVAQGREKIVKA